MLATQLGRAGGRTYMVRFIRSYQVYCAGDVATFPARLAQALVENDFAEPVNLGQGEPPPDGEPTIRPPGKPPLRPGADPELIGF